MSSFSNSLLEVLLLSINELAEHWKIYVICSTIIICMSTLLSKLGLDVLSQPSNLGNFAYLGEKKNLALEVRAD